MLSGFTVSIGTKTVRVRSRYKKCLGTTARLKACKCKGSNKKEYYHMEFVWQKIDTQGSMVGKSFAPIEFTGIMFAELFTTLCEAIDMGVVVNDKVVGDAITAMSGMQLGVEVTSQYPKDGNFSAIRKSDVWVNV